MHELALMESLVEAVEDNVGDARVIRIRLEVGALSCVVPDALRFCFEVCTHGRPLEGAALEILQIGATARCRACGGEGPVDGPIPVCRCGSVDLHILTGSELRLKDVEVL